MIGVFRASLFIKRPYNIFLLTFIMFIHVKVGKHIEYMGQKISKNMLIAKFIPGWSACTSFFPFFIPGWNFVTVFWTGMSSSRDEVSSREKRVNSKRHFIIDRDDFIQGWNFTCKHPLRVQMFKRCWKRCLGLRK